MRIHVFWLIFSFSLCFLSGNTKTLVNTHKRGNRSVCIQALSLFLSFYKSQKEKQKMAQKDISFLFTKKNPPPALSTTRKAPSQQSHAHLPHLPENQKRFDITLTHLLLPLEILKATTNLLLILRIRLRSPPTRPTARSQSSRFPRQQTRPAQP